jgi:hypothetical protein
MPHCIYTYFHVYSEATSQDQEARGVVLTEITFDGVYTACGSTEWCDRHEWLIGEWVCSSATLDCARGFGGTVSFSPYWGGAESWVEGRLRGVSAQQ